MLEILLFFLGILSGWFITHIYYKKSLTDQALHWEEIKTKLLNNKQTEYNVLYENRISTAMAAYKKNGTPKNVIDTFTDMPSNEKAKMYDDVLQRIKGRKGKNNPYLE